MEASAVTLRHDGHDVLITPLARGRWRVEYCDRIVESVHLEYAIADAIAIDGKQAISIAARLLDDYVASTLPPSGQDDANAPEPASAAESMAEAANKGQLLFQIQRLIDQLLTEMAVRRNLTPARSRERAAAREERRFAEQVERTFRDASKRARDVKEMLESGFLDDKDRRRSNEGTARAG